jgi:uncharacterized membrane protein
MYLLVAGLLLFLGTHSIRIFADDWRRAVIAAQGELRWKGLVSLLALAGLVLMVVGFGDARAATVVVWVPPVWTRHLAALLVLVSFILLVAGNLPGTGIKARLGHPMVVGVKIWAFAHLIANGSLADMVLFGSILAWSIVDFAASRRRDRREGVRYPSGRTSRDALAVVVGAVLWLVFARWGHAWLIGVSPFGG